MHRQNIMSTWALMLKIITELKKVNKNQNYRAVLIVLGTALL